MKDSAYKISLDINEHGSQVVLRAKQSDTGRKIYISLRAGGTPYTIEGDCYAVFTAIKPDGSILYNACTIEGNEIIYEFTGGTCAAVGRSRCEIKLYGKDDQLITSPRFALLIDGILYPDGRVESTDEFSALTQMVSDTLAVQKTANEAAENANEATENANAAAENAISATTAANQAANVATQAAKNANTATESANRSAARASEAAEAANNATTEANTAAENANEAATNVVRIVKSAMAVGEASGIVASMDDAVEFGFVGLRIYGKTTQDGTPTPDAPVDLVSIGDSGSITVSVTGENNSQSMTIATPNGLPGVPVTSGGNYTDANGQQWICDEIDFARGVYVQRINDVGFENAVGERQMNPGGTTYRFAFKPISNPTYLPSSHQGGMCNALSFRPAPIGTNGVDNSIYAYIEGGIYARCDAYDTVEKFIAWAKSIGLKVQYVLATPIVTPLSEEELAAYASLYTYRDSTTVSNDAGAYMELEYVMDAKKYIDSLVAGNIPQATGTILPATVE